MENHFVNEVYQNIWKDRYCKNNESYTDNLKRVANFVAQTEKDSDYWAEQFYNIMKEGLFFPGGRTMSNAGIGKHLTLNNCFVAPIINNSMEGIFEAVKLGAITHKAGGGIGYNFSNLSPRGTSTNNDAIASGPVSFMDVFDAQTATVQQGSRRGANMGVLSVYHPDIFEFLEAKSKDEKRLRHFNLSVLVDDKFMEAVESDKKITLHWPVFDVYGNLLPENMWVQVVPDVSAKDLWEKIISLAYDTGEPGVLFYDTMQRNNPANYIENIVGTNPCSEYLAGTIKTSVSPQEYGGACNLGSIFLHNFVKYPFTKKAYFDFDQLKRTIDVAVRFLDDIIDINKFPSKIYENYQRNLRTIGLGYTGLADMLVMLGLRYDTQEARAFVDKLMQECVRTAYFSSCALAEEKGEFPFCDRKLHSNTYYIKNIIADEDIQMSIKKNGIRNAKISAVAPTGTLSLTYGNNCSSGIEPIFSLSYDRKVKVGGQEDENIKIVKMQDYAYYLYNKLKEKNPEDITVSEDCFVTALNISVDDHIAMLETIAKYIDMSVSKTINVPTEYSFEDTKNIYYNCWKSGIKGCTIFRPNAIRQGILITNDNNSKADENSKSNDKNELKVKENKNNPTQDISLLKRGDIVECSDNLIGKKRKLQTGCGSLHVLAYFDPINGEMQEVYLNKGSTGGCSAFMTGLSRTISLLCRAGVDVYTIKDQLDSTGACPSYAVRSATKHDTSKGSCCPMAIGNALVKMYEEFMDEYGPVEFEDEDNISLTEPKTAPVIEERKSNSQPQTSQILCPECGEPLVFEGGCNSCKSCGYSKCG